MIWFPGVSVVSRKLERLWQGTRQSYLHIAFTSSILEKGRQQTRVYFFWLWCSTREPGCVAITVKGMLKRLKMVSPLFSMSSAKT